MNDLILFGFIVVFFYLLVRACRQTQIKLLRLLFVYIFICVGLWFCIVTTEGNLTKLRVVRYIGITFRPGYYLLAKKYPVETFGIRAGQK